jgi:predicted metal-dependent phosphoesterase TrpH
VEQIKIYKAGLHIHTVLSPCGDPDISPIKLVEQAKKAGLDIIGITDHNSTKHALLTRRIAARENIFVLCGAEITTKEEVHVLCFMPDKKKFVTSSGLYRHLPHKSRKQYKTIWGTAHCK